MGSRGPKPVDLGLLKLLATQWFYLLLGLRDGHPDLLQKHVWGPWTGESMEQISVGRAERILLARIIAETSGDETARLVFQRLTTYANKMVGDHEAQMQYPLYQTLTQDTALPKNWLFGLKSASFSLFFPAVPPQPQLWLRLKKPRSIKEVQQTGSTMYEWLATAAPGVHKMPEFRSALCDYPKELFRARALWNYPRTNRPTSDDKRLEFFAEALAGLMWGISPATATKKLSRWGPPRLWTIRFEGHKKAI